MFRLLQQAKIHLFKQILLARLEIIVVSLLYVADY